MIEAPMDDITSLAAGTPWAKWILGIGAIGILMTKFPEYFGGLGKAWNGWLESQRRAAEIKDDADIADLKRQISNLTAETKRLDNDVTRMRVEMSLRDQVLHDHYRWDVHAYQQIIALGGKIEPPPNLWPLDGGDATPPQ